MMGNAIVLCHTFEHDGRWFCFDTETNHIYECDEVVADLAPVWNQLADETVRRPFDQKWGRERVQTAFDEIAELNASEKVLTPKDVTIVHECSCCHSAELYESAIGHMQMTLTEQCNLRCEYCPYTNGRIGTRHHNDTYMSRETALAAVEFFMARNRDTATPAISFYGGEPLLQFELIKEVVAHIRSLQGDREIQLHLDTNGLLIDDEIAAYLVEEKFHVQLSLDGPKHIHDRYRKTVSGQGSYDQVIAGLERLLDLDPDCHQRIRFSSVIAPPYEIKEVLAYFTHFPPYEQRNITTSPAAGLKYADLSGIDFEPPGWDQRSQEKYDGEIADIKHRYMSSCLAGKHFELPAPLRTMFDGDIAQYHERSRDRMPDEFFPTGSCVPGQRKVHIKADGSLMPCERCGDNMIIGHLDSGFEMPMIHTLYEKLVDAVKSRCRECWAVRHCGICFIHMASHWQADGSGEIVIPEEMCQQIRDRMDRTFKNYLTLRSGGEQGLSWLKNMKSA